MQCKGKRMMNVSVSQEALINELKDDPEKLKSYMQKSGIKKKQIEEIIDNQQKRH